MRKLYSFIRKCALSLLRHTPRLRFAVRKLYWTIRRIHYNSKYKHLDTQFQTVLFESFGGRSISCSPRALFENMCANEQFSSWTFIWSIRNLEKGIQALEDLGLSHRCKCVVRGSKKYLAACAQAKYWIVNARMPEWIEPKPEQIFVQCWHGTPLKRLGFDVSVEGKAALNTNKELSARFLIDAKKWSYLLSPSAYTSKHLLSAFGATNLPNICVLEEGYPRNDSIIKIMESDDVGDTQTHLKQKLSIPLNRKVLLYAPTWRESNYRSGQGYVDSGVLNLEMLAEQLGDEWVVLLRTHYYITNSSELNTKSCFAINVTEHNDINDLYAVADALLTDYSSVFFDYANTNNPILYYWPDYEEYRNSLHGFYIDPMELPGPKCSTTQEVADELRIIDTWKTRYGTCFTEFQNRFCMLDNGSASIKVINKIFR